VTDREDWAGDTQLDSYRSGYRRVGAHGQHTDEEATGLIRAKVIKTTGLQDGSFSAIFQRSLPSVPRFSTLLRKPRVKVTKQALTLEDSSISAKCNISFFLQVVTSRGQTHFRHTWHSNGHFDQLLRFCRSRQNLREFCNIQSREACAKRQR